MQDFGEIAPIIALPDEAALDAAGWVDEARAALADKGAVLLRGPVFRPDAAELALSKLDDELLDDAFWSTPRSKVAGKTLTATEYPSPRTILLHSEMAYMPIWPRFVAFHSIEVADEGGETTVCDVDAMSADIADLLGDFAAKGVSYRRTFQKRVDVTWQQAFQTEDRADVEKVGEKFGMTTEWLPGDALVTVHGAQGTIAAEDGRPIYFSQAHLFHPSALPPETRAVLEKAVGRDRLPRIASYGDGTPIEEADLDRIRDAFEKHQTGMKWRPGDVLILDNMRYAHGRMPFKGSRKLHVALARAQSEPVRTPIFA